jgi:hypothetical protein
MMNNRRDSGNDLNCTSCFLPMLSDHLLFRCLPCLQPASGEFSETFSNIIGQPLLNKEHPTIGKNPKDVTTSRSWTRPACKAAQNSTTGYESQAEFFDVQISLHISIRALLKILAFSGGHRSEAFRCIHFFVAWFLIGLAISKRRANIHSTLASTTAIS